MTLNDRDRRILDFISVCPANSFVIRDMFFPSLQTAQRRLNKLHDEKLVKRSRSYFGDFYIYYIDKKPQQVEHALYVSKLYAHWYNMGCEIITFKREIVMGKIRSDAVAIIKNLHGEVKTYLVEVECSNNSMKKKVKQYEEFYILDVKDYLDCKPTLLFITNKKIPPTSLEYEVLRLDHI